MTDASRLVAEHVAKFNEGVRTGDFGPMLEGFTEDADLVFQGVPVGPFAGKQAIAAAYADQPPDDEIDVLHIQNEPGQIVARYAWRTEPDRRGRLIITPDGGRIARLVVTFDAEPAAGSASPGG